MQFKRSTLATLHTFFAGLFFLLIGTADRSLAEDVLALGKFTGPPEIHPAEGFAADGGIKPIYFDGLPWQGKPTRVFAWLGLPENVKGKIPGVVLVHGGGGTAFKEWVSKWNEQGFAAISIAVEGQTDHAIRRAKVGNVIRGPVLLVAESMLTAPSLLRINGCTMRSRTQCWQTRCCVRCRKSTPNELA